MTRSASHAGFFHWRDSDRRLLQLIAGVVALRIFIALTVPIDLSGDETYYWEWGRNPDIGYFSKPPLIGWLMAGLISLHGDTEIGLRLTATAFGAVTLSALAILARELFGSVVAQRAVLMVALAPIALPSNLLLTIDSPLVACWSVAMLAGWMVSAAPASSRGWKWTLATALAVGALAKQIMLVFPVLWLLWVLISADRRWLLAYPSTWLVVTAPLAALVPAIWWNAGQDWVTLAHTAGHFQSEAWRLSRALGWVGEFAISQLLIWGPVTVAASIAIVARSRLANGTTWEGPRGYLLMLSLPALAVVLALALRQGILPNWPAVFWLGLILFAAERMSAAVVRWSVLTAGAIQLTLGALVFAAPYLPAERHPLRRVVGWEEYARNIATVDRSQWPDRAKVAAQRAVIVVGHRYYASSLAFYHPDRPFVRVFQGDDTIRTQYGIWSRRTPVTQSEALIIVPGTSTSFPDGVQGAWSCAIFLGAQSSRIGQRDSRSFVLWRAKKNCKEKDSNS